MQNDEDYDVDFELWVDFELDTELQFEFMPEQKLLIGVITQAIHDYIFKRNDEVINWFKSESNDVMSFNYCLDHVVPSSFRGDEFKSYLLKRINFNE